MSDLNRLDQTIDGIFGLMTCIQGASDALGLSNEQIMAFCDATPNGEELWRQFTARRDSDETPDDYNFETFMVEVLAKTNHPVAEEEATTSSTQLYQGDSLDQQLSVLGQQRRLGESDWDCRRRVFPAIFNHDRRWAYEILFGKKWQNFSLIEGALFQGFSLGKNPTEDELVKFARGWVADPWQ